jgi:fluoride ion exporter CrcB/FEX
MARMQSLKPARKVWVGGLVGALVTIVTWVIETAANTKVPSAIAVAFSTLLTGIVSYFVPPADADQVTPT